MTIIPTFGDYVNEAAQPQRTLSEIAAEIRRDWKNPNFGAVPYINTMLAMGDITKGYGSDSGGEIVTKFLVNASQWKGEVAKRVKLELKAMLKAAGDSVWAPGQGW